jgi:hypothetical protein
LYGVPTDLDLTAYEGATLVQICLGSWQLQFRFSPKLPLPSPEVGGLECSISCEGDWQLIDPAGQQLDGRMEKEENRSEYRIHLLLGRAVVETRVQAPQLFELVSEGGYVLRFIEDDRPYESFQLYPSGFII